MKPTLRLYTFFRSDGFYPLELANDLDAGLNAIANPGTVRVEDAVTGREVWPLLNAGAAPNGNRVPATAEVPDALYDIHHALGIKWGDDLYSVIPELQAAARDNQELREKNKNQLAILNRIGDALGLAPDYRNSGDTYRAVVSLSEDKERLEFVITSFLRTDFEEMPDYPQEARQYIDELRRETMKKKTALSGEKNKANERLAAETPACRGGKGNEETGKTL